MQTSSAYPVVPQPQLSPPQPPSATEKFTIKVRPGAPAVMIPYQGELFGLPTSKLDFKCEFNVSTAFVKMTGEWKNCANFKDDCMFVLPVTGTVTNVSIEVQERVYDTVIIPKDEAAKAFAKNKETDKKDQGEQSSLLSGGADTASSGSIHSFFEEYIPNLFRLPIENVGPNDVVKITCVYIEPLPFFDGMYHFTLPLTLGQNLIPDGMTFDQVVKVKCIINSVCLNTPFSSKTHKVTALDDQFPRVELDVTDFSKPCEVSDPNVPLQFKSVDFTLSYSQSSDQILSTLIKEETDEENSFLLFMTPPSVTNISQYYARNIVFLLDRSGSMGGSPFNEATRALSAALSNLRPNDNFNVIAFDHNQKYFRNNLVAATADNINAASQWIFTVPPDSGTTDIMTPLDVAIQSLEGIESVSLPLVILLTDGCVPNERQICQHSQRSIKRTRILTLGIGSYCNWFFLKMLSQIARGFSDVVVYTEKIYTQILSLLSMAAVPVVTNVTLVAKGAKSLQLYPNPIPDLFMGAPLTISGTYEGVFPDQVIISATDPTGSPVSLTVPVRTSEVIPVRKVLIKQRLDLLTAKQWLEQSQKIEKEIVDLSCQAEMPSAFTQMVTYQRPPEHKDIGQDKDIESKDSSSSTADASNPFKQKAKKGSQWYRDPKMMAALVVGGGVLVGAAAFSFGDLAASASNLPVSDALGSAGGLDGGGDFGGGEGECCGEDCCGECECGDGCNGCDGCDGCGDCVLM